MKEIYLTIDDDEKIGILKSLVLKRLGRKGVTIIRGEGLGPHSKYFHYLFERWDSASPLILLDDDVIYGDSLIDDLWYSWRVNPNNNYCARSFLIAIRDGKLEPYRAWPLNQFRLASYAVFATNVGGVLLTPHFLNFLRSLGRGFSKNCATADDVWFHYASLVSNIPYCQIYNSFCNPPAIPLTQRIALHSGVNVMANDEAIQRSYGADEIIKISEGRSWRECNCTSSAI